MRTYQGHTETQMSESIDVLRKHLNIIRSRFFLLEERDRMIMSMYLDKGFSYRQIALLLHTSPSSVLKRIRKIIFELTRGIFISCMEQKKIFTPSEMAIAKDYFIGGLSIKQIAKNKKTSFYRIRELLKEIRQTVNNIQKEKL